jgi:hypothetical protein
MIGPSNVLHPSPAPHFKTFQVFLSYFPKIPIFSTIQKICTRCNTLVVSSYKSHFLEKSVVFLQIAYQIFNNSSIFLPQSTYRTYRKSDLHSTAYVTRVLCFILVKICFRFSGQRWTSCLRNFKIFLAL